MKLAKRNNLSILNSSEKCNGLWTRVEGNSRSVLDYVIVDEESNSALEKMSIDEEREHSPIGFNHEGNPVQSDHNVIICDFNWLISEDQQRKQERKTITEKGWIKIKKELEDRQVSTILSTANMKDRYTEWKAIVYDIVERNKTSVRTKNPRKVVKMLIKERRRLKKLMRRSSIQERTVLLKELKAIDEQIQQEHNNQQKNKLDKVVDKLWSKKGFKGSWYVGGGEKCQKDRQRTCHCYQRQRWEYSRRTTTNTR